MIFTFTILQQNSSYTYIWPPAPAAAHPDSHQSLAGNLCWATVALQEHQHAELAAAIDSAAQTALYLRPQSGSGAPADAFANSPLTNNQFTSNVAASKSGAETDSMLARLGRLLFSHLLPPLLQKRLRELPPATSLLIRTNESELPWELLHDGQGFLALRHAVARQMLHDDSPLRHAQRTETLPAPTAALRCLLVGNPNGNLPAAELEIENLLEAFDTAALPLRVEFLCREQASKMRVLNALASGEYAILHFATHARAGAISLADDWLGAEEITSVLRGHPLVFLNACSSGRMANTAHSTGPFAGQQAHSLAHAFLAGGAAAFVGTFWPVDDADTRWLALEYYHSFLNGASLGHALQHARSRSQNRAPLAATWAAPVLYGDPTYRLPDLDAQPRPATLLALRLPVGHEQSHANSTETGERTTENPRASETDERTEQLRRFLLRAATTVTAHGGQFVTHAPWQVYAIFGVSTPLEDDAVRAMRAGLEIARLSETEAIDARLAVASGKITPLALDRHAFAGPLPGGQTTHTSHPLYLGRVFGEAEHLLALGQPGQLLSNAHARQLSEGRFVFTPLLSASAGDATKADQAEGELSEQIAYVVSPLPDQAAAALESQPATLRQRGQLLGRERELSLLTSYWQSASQGRGLVVGIAGEAGIGKTRLLAEFRSTLAPTDHRLVTLTCASTGQDRPYMLVGQLLRQIFEIDPAQGGEAAESQIARRLGELPGQQNGDDPQLSQILRETLGFTISELPPEERKARRGRLVHLLRTLMAGAAQQTPLLIAIDDTHWIDKASLEVLTQVTDGINRLPVQVLLLYRPDWQHSWFDKPYYRHLHLEQLDEVASVEMLCMLLQSDTLPKGLALLLHKTGGNPFFITEMVKSLQETGILYRRATSHDGANGWELQRPLTEQLLPDTIERLLRVRLERLPVPARRLLETASVIGPVFRLELLQNLVGEVAHSLDAHLAELGERGFVEARWDVQEYRFCHALILDAVYQSLPSNQRMAWHRRIAEIFEAEIEAKNSTGDVEVETLAHHYYQSMLRSRVGEAPKFDQAAPPQQIARTCFYLAQAGKRAQARHAARESLNFYQRARLLYSLTDEQLLTEADIHEGIGDAYNTLGDFDAADHALRQAYAALHTKPLDEATSCRAADLARRIGRLCAWQGEHETALRWMRQGLRTVTELPALADGPSTSEANSALATAAMLHVHIGSVEYNRGNLAEALAECSHGLALSRESAPLDMLPAQAEAHNLLGIMAWARGDNLEALHHLGHSHELWEKLGNRYQAARVNCNIGVVHFHMADWPTARTHYLPCLAYWQQIEDQDMFALTSLNLGNIHLYQGEWRLAEEMLEQAMVVWMRAQNQRWLGLCHTNLGLLYLEQGEWGKAQLHLEESRSLLVRHNIRDLLPEALAALAEVHLGLAQVDEALVLAQEARTLAVELNMRQEEAFALRTLGKALAFRAEVDRAVDCMAQSQSIYESLGNRYELGRTLYQRARLFAPQATQPTSPEPIAASDVLHHELQQALSLFTELGADHDLRNARALFQSIAARSEASQPV